MKITSQKKYTTFLHRHSTIQINVILPIFVMDIINVSQTQIHKDSFSSPNTWAPHKSWCISHDGELKTEDLIGLLCLNAPWASPLSLSSPPGIIQHQGHAEPRHESWIRRSVWRKIFRIEKDQFEKFDYRHLCLWVSIWCKINIFSYLHKIYYTLFMINVWSTKSRSKHAIWLMFKCNCFNPCILQIKVYTFYKHSFLV